MSKLAIILLIISFGLSACEKAETPVADNTPIKYIDEPNIEENIDNTQISSSIYEPRKVADGFDYPIGDRGYDPESGQIRPIDEQINDSGTSPTCTITDYNVDRNEEYNLEKNICDDNSRSVRPHPNGWFNASDVGNFLGWYKGSFYGGVHPAEDWNYTEGNVGEEVYAVANGVVIKINTAHGTVNSGAWYIVIKHQLPKPNGTEIYSVYMHVTSADHADGHILTDKTDFYVMIDGKRTQLKEGVNVERGQVIARIAAVSVPHLHFEIRDNRWDGDNNGNYSSYLYTKFNGMGYYSDKAGIRRATMTPAQIKEAFKLMRAEGILDPSDFIDDHRPFEGSHLDGAGSIIRTKKVCWGCDRDMVKLHPHNVPSTAVFQWSAVKDCEYLKIRVASDNHLEISNKHLEVRVQTKNWFHRSIDESYTAKLPITVSKNGDTEWNLTAITTQKNLNDPVKIIAECTSDPISFHREVMDKEPLVFGDGYHWTGNASLIAYENKPNYGQQDVGVRQDWAITSTSVGDQQNNSLTIFQWQPSERCSSLHLDTVRPGNNATDNNKTEIDQINIKRWNKESWSEENLCSTLPCTVDAPTMNGDYYILRIKTTANAVKSGYIHASCVR